VRTVSPSDYGRVKFMTAITHNVGSNQWQRERLSTPPVPKVRLTKCIILAERCPCFIINATCT